MYNCKFYIKKNDDTKLELCVNLPESPTNGIYSLEKDDKKIKIKVTNIEKVLEFKQKTIRYNIYCEECND